MKRVLFRCERGAVDEAGVRIEPFGDRVEGEGFGARIGEFARAAAQRRVADEREIARAHGRSERGRLRRERCALPGAGALRVERAQQLVERPRSRAYGARVCRPRCAVRGSQRRARRWRPRPTRLRAAGGAAVAHDAIANATRVRPPHAKSCCIARATIAEPALAEKCLGCPGVGLSQKVSRNREGCVHSGCWEGGRSVYAECEVGGGRLYRGDGRVRAAVRAARAVRGPCAAPIRRQAGRCGRREPGGVPGGAAAAARVRSARLASDLALSHLRLRGRGLPQTGAPALRAARATKSHRRRSPTIRSRARPVTNCSHASSVRSNGCPTNSARCSCCTTSRS